MHTFFSCMEINDSKLIPIYVRLAIFLKILTLNLIFLHEILSSIHFDAVSMILAKGDYSVNLKVKNK